ncbi:MAG: alpha/beta hydrolase family protein [Armatimonadota bacterium]
MYRITSGLLGLLAMITVSGVLPCSSGYCGPTAPRIMRLADGTRFAVLGEKPSAPAPTLFVFALDCESTLKSDKYNQIGIILGNHGFICVSLDMPCHGEDVRDGEPEQLVGWRTRADENERFVTGFTTKASAVFDYLIKEGYTDPGKAVTCGTSRGGFMAFHFAAADSRVRCAVGFSPVTDLLALREFSGSSLDGRAASLSLNRFVPKLAGRALWICIGNDDQRVGTDSAISFARSAAKASVAVKKAVQVDLHVTESIGHSTPDDAHLMAAEWIRRQLGSRIQIGNMVK